MRIMKKNNILRRAIIALSVIICMAFIMPATSTVSAASKKVTYLWPTAVQSVHGPWGLQPGHYRPYHYGVDIMGGKWAKVYAVAPGKVIGTGNAGAGHGYRVQIRHSNGTVSLYAHLQPGSIRVKKGDKVRAGKWIARVGNTGGNYPYHLHFGIYKSANAFHYEDGRPAYKITINPAPLFTKWLRVSSRTTAKTGKPVISWTSYPETAKYEVCYKTKSMKYFKHLKTTTGNSCTFKDAKPNYGYYFKIKAYNKKGKVIKVSKIKYQKCKSV